MSYASNADIQERLGTLACVQLTDDEGTGSPVQSRITEAREAAEAEITGYLARRFAVPLPTEGQPYLAVVLRSMTVDLAEHRLRGRRPPIPADASARRAAVVDCLQRVVEGRFALPVAAELPGSAAGGLVAAIVGSRRMWSREAGERL
jgi:phage gp36-like protein